MILPPQAAGGRLAARRVLPGKPDQDILGAVDTGAAAACAGARARRRAGLRFSGESARLKCVHREHVVVLDTYFGSVDICGKAEHVTIHELDMGPEPERAGINAILGLDVLGGLKIAIDVPGGTGTTERRAGA